MNALQRLRQVVEGLPIGGGAYMPREALAELLADVETAGTGGADLTVEQLAVRFGRASSTVRGWLEKGRFPGAYRLRGREWRAPAAAVTAFEREERNGTVPNAGRSNAADLKAWRRVS